MGFFGAQEEEKKSGSDQRVGIIANVSMDGSQKRVSIESLLLIQNNLSRTILKLYCKESIQDDF